MSVNEFQCHLSPVGDTSCLSASGPQRFSLSLQKSPTVQNLWLQGHENCKPNESSLISRGFLCEDSSILILWVIFYQIRSCTVSHGSGCSSGLFTDVHFLRHKVTELRVQHSTSCKYNKTRWRMAEDRWLQVDCCSFRSIFVKFNEAFHNT